MAKLTVKPVFWGKLRASFQAVWLLLKRLLGVNKARDMPANNDPDEIGLMRSVRFQLTGDIEIINSCDGLVDSIPTQVIVSTALNDNQQQKAFGSVTVNLTPDSAALVAGSKVGRYSITDIRLTMPAGFGAPTSWDAPTLTLPGGGTVCGAIPCPAPGRRCATGPLVAIPFMFQSPTTTADIRILCRC